MTREAPAWLEGFQEQFSAMLRAPLDRSSGTLRAAPGTYPGELVAATLPTARADGAARLAIYNRQYWFRLFTVMQREFPLTAALTGAWDFNGVCAAFLDAHPPVGHALTHAGDGFAAFVEGRYAQAGMPLTRETLPGPALVQAVGLDEAFRTVFWAPEVDPDEMAPLRRSIAQAGGTARLRPSGRFTLVCEWWPLVALRRQATAVAPGTPLSLPDRLPSQRHVAIHRGRAGAAVLPLTRLQAALYRRLGGETIEAAVAHLDADAIPSERAELPAQVAEWMALSVRLGFWAGVEPC